MPGSPAARAAAEAARRKTKQIVGVIQTGQYPDIPANSPVHGENSGDNLSLRYLLANNYHLVHADRTLLLDSADHCGFTLSNPMALPPEPVPVDPSLWRSVFPPHLPASIEKGGRWLFRGKPPEEAFSRGAAEIAARVADEAGGPDEEMRRTFLALFGTDEAGAWWAARCVADIREVVALHFDALRELARNASDWPQEEIDRVGGAAMEFSQVRSDLFEEAAAAWRCCLCVALADECRAVADLERELDRSLIAAAAEWKSRPDRYRAEDRETPPVDANVHILANEKLRIERDLAAVWPPDAIWPDHAWTAEGRAEVEDARRRGARGNLAEAQRLASIKAAVDRIVTLNDELQDYRDPEAGEAPRNPSRRLRVLLGTVDETSLASPETIPSQARETFRTATRRHCEHLWDAYRQAKAYRQRIELAESEVAAARTAERDAADRAAGTAHAADKRMAS